MRREQNVEVKFLEQLLIAFEAGVDEQSGLMGIGDDFLEDVIAAVGRVTDDFHAEPDVGEVLGSGGEIPALFMKESFAVGDEELEVADLRRVDGGKINFVNHAGGSGEPEAARGRVRRADRV